MSRRSPKFGWPTAAASFSIRSESCAKYPWFSTVVRMPIAAPISVTARHRSARTGSAWSNVPSNLAVAS